MLGRNKYEEAMLDNTFMSDWVTRQCADSFIRLKL